MILSYSSPYMVLDEVYLFILFYILIVASLPQFILCSCFSLYVFTILCLISRPFVYKWISLCLPSLSLSYLRILLNLSYFSFSFLWQKGRLVDYWWVNDRYWLCAWLTSIYFYYDLILVIVLLFFSNIGLPWYLVGWCVQVIGIFRLFMLGWVLIIICLFENDLV